MLRPQPPRSSLGLPHMQARWTLFIMRRPLPARMTRARSGMCILPKRRITEASFAQSAVSNTSNHMGVICTNGTGCAPGTRNLLDLFKVAINPVDGRAAVIYTDDTLTKDTAGNPLPQIVLAAQQ